MSIRFPTTAAVSSMYLSKHVRFSDSDPTSPAASFHINPLFALATVPAILFDLAPNSLHSFACSGFVPPKTLSKTSLLCQPITYPPTASLILKSDSLPWFIKVKPISNKSHWKQQQFITIADTLSCILDTLQLPVTRAEYASFSPHLQHRVAAQFHRRVGRIADVKHMEKIKNLGVKRIDVLLGRTFFHGLTVCNSEWESNRPPVLKIYFN